MHGRILNKTGRPYDTDKSKKDKIDGPYPNGILLRRRHLWNKEKYLTLYRFEITKIETENNTRLWL